MEVLIKKIGPDRFASFYGFGKHPEDEAMGKLLKWCGNKHINIDTAENILIGFNNPNPISASGEYGYEFWFKVDNDERPENDVRIIEYHGGNYAVTECTGIQQIFETWQALYKWCIDNNYKLGYHQALERFIENISDIEKIRIELCCPIEVI